MESCDTSASEKSNGVNRRRVAIVDDHPLVRRGMMELLREQPDIQLVGEAECEKEALEVFQTQEVDLLLIDWSLKRRDSSGLIQSLLIQNPLLKVLVVSVHDESTHAELAIRSGARGYIMKQEATEKIVVAVRALLAGHYFLSDRALESLSTHSMRQVSGFEVVGQSRFGPEAIQMAEPFSGWAISVVIPVFNSAETLIPLCERLITTLRSARSLQVILVDDCSTDNSADVCNALAGWYPSVVEFIGLARNFGEHSAILTGLREVRGDYCVLMDDDLQNPPEEVPALLRHAAFGFDVVYSKYAVRSHPLYRRIVSSIHNGMACFLIGKPRGLYLSSFKVLSAGLVAKVCSYSGPLPYLDALILRATSSIGTVCSRHEARPRGRSGYSLLKLFGLWWRIVFGFSNWSLRTASIMAVIGIALTCSWSGAETGSLERSLRSAGIGLVGVAVWVLFEHLGLIRDLQLGVSPVVIRRRSTRNSADQVICAERNVPKAPLAR